MTKQTKLKTLQKEIDTCNHKNGCDSKCSKEKQKECLKLKAHSARMEYCREKGFSIELW